MSKDTVQGAGHLGEVQRLHEQACVSDLPASAAAHEPPKLLLGGPSEPRGLLLEGAEGSKLSLGIDDPFHGFGTERSDQLVLKVRDADEETESLHICTSEVGAEAGPFEPALEVALLRGVTKSRQSEVKPLRAEPIQEASDVRRTPDRHDGNALGVEIPTTAHSQRLEREPVADSLDEHDRACEKRLSGLRCAAEAVEPAVLLVGKPRHEGKLAPTLPPAALSQWLPTMGTRTVAQSFAGLLSLR
jgi:hypothetical protein